MTDEPACTCPTTKQLARHGAEGTLDKLPTCTLHPQPTAEDALTGPLNTRAALGNALRAGFTDTPQPPAAA